MIQPFWWERVESGSLPFCSWRSVYMKFVITQFNNKIVYMYCVGKGCFCVRSEWIRYSGFISIADKWALHKVMDRRAYSIGEASGYVDEGHPIVITPLYHGNRREQLCPLLYATKCTATILLIMYFDVNYAPLNYLVWTIKH